MALNKTTNPFENTLEIEYIEKVTGRGFSDGTVKTYGYNIDVTPTIRVYSSKPIRDLLFQTLSIHARDYLTAIQHFTKKGRKFVVITLEKMCDLYGEPVSRQRFEKTLRELRRWAVIDCKDIAKGEYWYDPTFFSTGSRLKMYPDNTKKIASSAGGGELLSEV